MKTFKHTDKTAAIFNNMLHDYQGIDSDKELVKRGLTYNTYEYMGLPIDQLRFDGKTVVQDKSLADYFKKFGFSINLLDNGYFVSFDHVSIGG